MPRLVITKGPGIGRDHAIGTECVVGRGLDADFVVEDGGVSRRHCRVCVDGGRYAVEDLGSRNGTFVNAERVVQRRVLGDGDLVRVGGIEMVFRQVSMTSGASPTAAVPATPPAIPKPLVPPRVTTVATPPPPPDRPKYDIQPRRRRPGR